MPVATNHRDAGSNPVFRSNGKETNYVRTKTQGKSENKNQAVAEEAGQKGGPEAWAGTKTGLIGATSMAGGGLTNGWYKNSKR